MPGAAIGAGASLLGGYLQNRAAGDAQDAQTQASEAAIAEQRRQYDQSRADQQPFVGYGTGAGGLGGLQSLMSGDYSGFENSPDYKYAREQMIYGQDHSASARGRLQSGGYAMDLAQGLNGLASQNLGNYRGALQWGANLGQNAAAGVGQLGANTANQISGAYGQMGQAGAQGAYDRGNAWGTGLSGLSQGLSSYFGSR
ncbi:MAG: hypothetical protein A3E01_06955 [Gammaproteobacteria bacterium RIFCSPHIGHO2_12_FULL_63_22]|nr:MAG: hypothetical protein A3E01_06955 [Gammaproteobacteria bacterium RIFCSPHIGHO2_12_FULL_63_22]